MVEKEPYEDTAVYVCAVCQAAYPEEEWAEKCNGWCETHDGNSNPEITAHSVKVTKEQKY
ncbi:hypothetical protein ACFLWR_01765 [Chloroflexota bacterium]